MNAEDKSGLLKALDAYLTLFPDEIKTVQRTRDFLTDSENPFPKSNLPGQVTASAIPYRPDTGEILFIWHEKLQRWLQPGGHVEGEDDSLEAAAIRELEEETEIQIDGLHNQSTGQLIDLDIHPIPEKGLYPEHFHYDFRFVFEISKETGIPVKHRWFTIEELIASGDASLSRYARKLKAQLAL